MANKGTWPIGSKLSPGLNEGKRRCKPSSAFKCYTSSVYSEEVRPGVCHPPTHPFPRVQLGANGGTNWSHWRRWFFFVANQTLLFFPSRWALSYRVACIRIFFMHETFGIIVQLFEVFLVLCHWCNLRGQIVL